MANPQFLLERDTLNGKLGQAFVTIDGQSQELFRAKKINVSADIQSTDVPVVGTTRIQQKTTGVKQTGTMTIYYGTPLLTQMAMTYMETGVMTYFDLQVTNNDPTATVGTQTMVYYGCKLTGELLLSIIDVDTEMLEQECTFSYTNARTLSSFTTETNYGS